MRNIEAVKKWAELEHGADIAWSLRDIRDLIYEGIKQYNSPVKPKPLKLEVGCRVDPFAHLPAEVVHIEGDNVCVRFLESENLQIFSPEELTVIEAATPEVGDYVRLGVGKYSGKAISISEVLREPVGICDIRFVYRMLVAPGTFGEFTRQDFTILHKAPRE